MAASTKARRLAVAGPRCGLSSMTRRRPQKLGQLISLVSRALLIRLTIHQEGLHQLIRRETLVGSMLRQEEEPPYEPDKHFARDRCRSTGGPPPSAAGGRGG